MSRGFGWRGGYTVLVLFDHACGQSVSFPPPHTHYIIQASAHVTGQEESMSLTEEKDGKDIECNRRMNCSVTYDRFSFNSTAFPVC